MRSRRSTSRRAAAGCNLTAPVPAFVYAPRFVVIRCEPELIPLDTHIHTRMTLQPPPSVGADIFQSERNIRGLTAVAIQRHKFDPDSYRLREFSFLSCFEPNASDNTASCF